MIHIITAIVGMWVLITYPQVAVTAASLIVILYYLPRLQGFKSAGNENSQVKPSKVNPKLKEIYGDFVDDDGIIDWDGYNQAKVDAMMKADFEKDPEYQEKLEKVRKHMEENRIKARVEEVEDKNREIRDKEQEFWAKRR